MSFIKRMSKLLSRTSEKPSSPTSDGGSKLERKLVQAMLNKASVQTVQKTKTIKNFNAIILKFPKLDEAFETVRHSFNKFDKDRSGTIDFDELKTCFEELQVHVPDEEVKEYLAEADMDSSKQISFKEFIITLALVYLIGPQPQAGSDAPTKSRIGMPKLEAALETVVDAFLFFDRDRDGYVSKEELNAALTDSDASPGKGAGKIGMQRFDEMDWDKSGAVTFKEFLYAFAAWVGIEDDDD